MASNLLRIVGASQDIEIDEEKLRRLCNKVNIWDHYSISRSQYVSLNDNKKLKILKGFYKNLLPVYYNNGKCQFCCNNCVWAENGRKQDYHVINVILGMCFSDSEKILSDQNTDLKNMIGAVNF